MKLNNVNEIFYDTVHHYEIGHNGILGRMANLKSSLNNEKKKKSMRTVI